MAIKKYVNYSISIVLTLFIFGHVYYKLNGDFRSSTILKSQNIDNQTIEDKQLVQTILLQPFKFLGHGNQTYVFLSHDEKYVLKFFKNEYLKRDWYISLIPAIYPFKPFLVYNGQSKDNRKQKLLNGYSVASHFDKENTGLVYVQYQPSLPLNVEVALTDGLGIKHHVNVDDYVFAIQKRVIPTRKELTTLLKAGDVIRAKERIRQLFDLYLVEYQLAIFDHDHNVIDNTGFIGERAVRHDVGKIVRDESYRNPEIYLQDLKKIAWVRIDPWIASHFPDYRDDIASVLEEYVPRI